MQSLHDFMRYFSSPRRQSLRVMGSAALALALPAARAAQAPPVLRIAAASDLKFALASVLKPFELQNKLRVEVSFGASGHFARQILQGLPVDIFMSADEDWAFKVADAGWSQGGPAERGVVYALGRLALIVPAASSLSLDPALRGLQAQWPSVRKFAIANPQLAPYGRAAQQALQTLGVWQAVQSKLVIGDNIAQATQFVTTGAAQAGITALSLAAAPQVAVLSQHVVLPADTHAPLRQRMLLRKNAPPAAQQLYAYLHSEQARTLLQSYGL
jgi:molybdate transport system substrate-binding protein